MPDEAATDTSLLRSTNNATTQKKRRKNRKRNQKRKTNQERITWKIEREDAIIGLVDREKRKVAWEPKQGKIDGERIHIEK